MNSRRLNLKLGMIIFALLFCTAISFGHDQVIRSDQVELYLIKKPNCTMRKSESDSGVIQKPQLKFTVSDSWFGRDKVHHFLTSAFLSSAGYYFFHEGQIFSNLKSQQGGFCFSISLGLIKEIRDGFKPNNAFSMKDLIADILGTVVGIALVCD